jgi:hypothetical protein
MMYYYSPSCTGHFLRVKASIRWMVLAQAGPQRQARFWTGLQPSSHPSAARLQGVERGKGGRVLLGFAPLTPVLAAWWRPLTGPRCPGALTGAQELAGRP